MTTSSNSRLLTTHAILALVLLSAGCATSPRVSTGPSPAGPSPSVTPVTSGAGVITAMHDRYAGKWYGTMTFVQRTTIALASGPLVQTWYEAAALPGRLRIDIDALGRDGILFANDSIYRFSDGRLAAADTGMNDLLILGFDVYGQPAERTREILRSRGFDLSRFHEETWAGKPVYVVGALQGDTTSKQFWVDRDRLLFVRLMETHGTQHADLRFENYVQHGQGWVAERVVQFVNGKQRVLEEYSDVRVDVPLSADLFDPAHWTTARWR